MDQHPWVSLKEILKIRLILSISNLDIMAFIQFHSWGVEIIFRSLVFLHFLFYDQHHVLNVHCFIVEVLSFSQRTSCRLVSPRQGTQNIAMVIFLTWKGNMNQPKSKSAKKILAPNHEMKC